MGAYPQKNVRKSLRLTCHIGSVSVRFRRGKAKIEKENFNLGINKIRFKAQNLNFA